MRLILSSRDFRGEQSRACILRNLPRPIAECRVLFIPNEKATAESIASGGYHSRLAEFGFSREKVTVYDPARAGEFFGLAVDVIYVSGGNTFATLERVRREGFDRELVRLIRAGTTYIGGSAGAHLVTSAGNRREPRGPDRLLRPGAFEWRADLPLLRRARRAAGSPAKRRAHGLHPHGRGIAVPDRVKEDEA